MKNLSLHEQLEYQLSLLDKKKKAEIERHFKKNKSDSEIKQLLDRALGGESIIVPEMDYMINQIRQKIMTADSKNKGFPLKNHRFFQRIIYPLAATAVIAWVIFSGIINSIFSTPIPDIYMSLKKGKVYILPDKKVPSIKKQVLLHKGETIISRTDTEYHIRLPHKGKIIFWNRGNLKLSRLKIIEDKPDILWHVSEGHLNVKLHSQSYASFRIITPQALFTVTGTEFTLRVTLAKTVLFVKRGKVRGRLVNKKEKVIDVKADMGVNFFINEIIVQKRTKILLKNTGKKEFKERVYLRNGMVITGIILSQNSDTMVIKTHEGVIHVSMRKVKNVECIKDIRK